MAKYRVKTAGIFPGFAVGSIVEANEELDPLMKAHLEPASEDEELTETTAGDNDTGPTPLVNPDRAQLKKLAEELGIDYAPNITTDKLMQLVNDAQMKRQAGDGTDKGGDAE